MAVKLIRYGASTNAVIAHVSKYSSLNTTYMNFFTIFSSYTFLECSKFLYIFYKECSIYEGARGGAIG